MVGLSLLGNATSNSLAVIFGHTFNTCYIDIFFQEWLISRKSIASVRWPCHFSCRYCCGWLWYMRQKGDFLCSRGSHYMKILEVPQLLESCGIYFFLKKEGVQHEDFSLNLLEVAKQDVQRDLFMVCCKIMWHYSLLICFSFTLEWILHSH